MSDVEPGQPATPSPEQSTLAPPAPEAPTPAPAPVHHPRTLTRGLAAAIVAAIVLATGSGIGIGWNIAHFISSHNATHAAIQTVPIDQGSTGGTALSPTAAAAKVMPAVVDVNTTIKTANGQTQAAGTGLLLDSNGDILTNNHVVEGSISVSVRLQGRSGSYSASVLGVDPSDDLAVIHVDGVSGLPHVTFGDSSSVKINDGVLAIGNALGLGGTPRVTQGFVTDINQTITASEGGSSSETLTGMIQSDAQISPGDSGGALVNSKGQVIGIITAGQATGFRTSTSNVGFAIPSNTAVRVANQILSGQAGNGVLIGPVGHLGVGVITLDPDTASQLGLTITSGALVRTVEGGSPAASAGMVPGAVITAINATAVDGSSTLGQALWQFKPGDQVQVTWILQGKSHTSTVTLVNGPTV